MVRRKRRVFSDEEKLDAVRIVQTSGRSAYQVAQELNLSESALRRWVKQAEIDSGEGTEDQLMSSEKEELRRPPFHGGSQATFGVLPNSPVHQTRVLSR